MKRLFRKKESGPSERKRSDSADSEMSTFKVSIPDGVSPGQEFQVHAGGRIVRVRCPPNSKPGQTVQITVPKDPVTQKPNSPNVTKVQDNEDGTSAYMVGIPNGVRGGQQFPVMIEGQELVVTCPPNARPGTKLRVIPPRRQQEEQAPSPRPSPRQQTKDEATQLFEVTVPPGVQPGQPFALLAGGVRVLVNCPINAGPGQRIRFKLPLALTQKPKHQSDLSKVKLSYDKDGWTRTIRVSDFKFQWIRMDEQGDIETNDRFDAEKSAYVRVMEFKDSGDPRIRDGEILLVPANEAFVDSRVRNDQDEILVTYSEIAEAQVKTFEEKAAWFQGVCSKLSVEWNEGYMRINVRREHLLEDSVDAIMSLSRKDLRKSWIFEFIGEMGLDAGGLAREWFQLVTEDIFDPDRGFWASSETNQMCMQINPASKLLHDDYLMYYRFMGRVMGKALFDGKLVSGHMVQYMYKHLLGWPITLKDIKNLDEDYYNNLKQITQLASSGEDLEMLCLDFTTTQEILGAKEDIELVEGGADIEVTNDNFPEYLEACLKDRMMKRVQPQLKEILLGFFDVIPEALLTVFDFQELELLMCGLPRIDMDDWMEHTEYSGDYEFVGANCDVVQWFWEVVSEFDEELKARLLQFVTGTSGVPARGFGVLQGNNGNIRKFTIHGLPVEVCLYPRAHTCFNRIDLPNYTSKEELREKLKLAVTMVATGFDIE